MSSEEFVFEPFDLPVFDIPQKEWRPKAISWETAIDELEWSRKYYIEHFDTPEKRLATKNPKPFVL